jgi:hypothetical protein
MARPFQKVGILGLGVIAMSLVLTQVFPKKAPWMMTGFSTPIMAFEFIQTPREVEQFFGIAKGLDPGPMARAMDLGNQLDYLYMILYTGFLFSFAWVVVRITSKKRYYMACLLALVTLGADAMENIQLMEITAQLPGLDFSSALIFLPWFTWIKWFGITLTFLTLAPYFMDKTRFSKLMGLTGTTSAALALAAFFHRSILNELMGLAIALTFVLMIIHSFIFTSPYDR